MIEARAYSQKLTFASLSLAAALAFVPAACSSSSSKKDGGAGTDGGGGGAGRISGGAGSDGSAGGTAGAGAAGSGGSAGQGGSGGNPACAVAGYRHTSGFGSIFDGWVAMSPTTPSLNPMAGVDGGPPTGTIVELDSTQGMPPGSAKLTIPFDGTGEQFLFAQNMNGINLQHAIVTAYIKLDSGLNLSPQYTGIAYLVLKTTTAYNFAPGQAINLDSSAGFVQLSLNADAPNTNPPFGYDPCDVREIDVEIDTPNTGTFTTAVIHIDTIEVSGPAVDGGTDGSGSDDAAAGN